MDSVALTLVMEGEGEGIARTTADNPEALSPSISAYMSCEEEMAESRVSALSNTSGYGSEKGSSLNTSVDMGSSRNVKIVYPLGASPIIAGLLENKPVEDATLVCEDGTIGVHKFMLAASSPYLRQILKRHEKGRVFIHLPDVKIEVMTLVMQMCYYGGTICSAHLVDEIKDVLHFLWISDDSKTLIMNPVKFKDPVVAVPGNGERQLPRTEEINNNANGKSESSETTDCKPPPPVQSNALGVYGFLGGTTVIQYSCMKCEFRTEGKLIFLKHCRSAHKTKPRWENTPEDDVIELKRCPFCLESHRTVLAANDCLKENGFKRCYSCFAIVPTKDYVEHCVTAHGAPSKFGSVMKCRWCDLAVVLSDNNKDRESLIFRHAKGYHIDGKCQQPGEDSAQSRKVKQRKSTQPTSTPVPQRTSDRKRRREESASDSFSNIATQASNGSLVDTTIATSSANPVPKNSDAAERKQKQRKVDKNGFPLQVGRRTPQNTNDNQRRQRNQITNIRRRNERLTMFSNSNNTVTIPSVSQLPKSVVLLPLVPEGEFSRLLYGESQRNVQVQESDSNSNINPSRDPPGAGKTKDHADKSDSKELVHKDKLNENSPGKSKQNSRDVNASTKLKEISETIVIKSNPLVQSNNQTPVKLPEATRPVPLLVTSAEQKVPTTDDNNVIPVETKRKRTPSARASANTNEGVVNYEPRRRGRPAKQANLKPTPTSGKVLKKSQDGKSKKKKPTASTTGTVNKAKLIVSQQKRRAVGDSKLKQTSLRQFNFRGSIITKTTTAISSQRKSLIPVMPMKPSNSKRQRNKSSDK